MNLKTYNFSEIPKSIVILAQEKLGDAILLTPLIKNLKIFFPDIKIRVVCFGYNVQFFKNDSNIDLVFNAKEKFINTVHFFRKNSSDLLFNPKDHPSFTFQLFSKLCKAKYKIGIKHIYHQGWYHYLIDLPFNSHVIYKNCSVLGYLGIKKEKIDFRPYIPNQETSDYFKSFLNQIKQRKIIGINLSAGEESREWPIEKWSALISNIDSNFVVFADRNKINDKIKLENEFKNVLFTPVTKSIFEAALIIKNINCLITPDTALIHVASCYNLNLIGLYRSLSIHLERFYPFQTVHEIIQSKTHLVADIPVSAVHKKLLRYIERARTEIVET